MIPPECEKMHFEHPPVLGTLWAVATGHHLHNTSLTRGTQRAQSSATAAIYPNRALSEILKVTIVTVYAGTVPLLG